MVVRPSNGSYAIKNFFVEFLDDQPIYFSTMDKVKFANMASGEGAAVESTGREDTGAIAAEDRLNENNSSTVSIEHDNLSS